MLDIRLVTANSECWINHEVDLDYPIIKRKGNSYINKGIDFEHEISLLEKKDKLNEPIYIFPHEKSKLREFIINKHLNEGGFVDESCFGNIYDVIIDGHKFSYRITKCKERTYTEQELREFEQSLNEFNKKYEMFTNKIYGL